MKQHRLRDLHLNQYFQEVFGLDDKEPYEMMIELMKFEELLR